MPAGKHAADGYKSPPPSAVFAAREDLRRPADVPISTEFLLGLTLALGEVDRPETTREGTEASQESLATSSGSSLRRRLTTSAASEPAKAASPQTTDATSRPAK